MILATDIRQNEKFLRNHRRWRQRMFIDILRFYEMIQIGVYLILDF